MKLFHATILAQELMHLHGLEGWKFAFDRAKKRFGCCNYTQKKISLSADMVLLNGEMEVKNTLLHEIAHAIAGHHAGHGKQWKEIVEKIGGTANRCYGNEITTPLLCFTAYCASCGIRTQRQKKRNLICAKCKTILSWKKN